MLIDLNLCEIEILLLATAPRDKQDLGKHYQSAKGKLQRARIELLEPVEKVNADGVDFVQETQSLFDLNG